MKSIIIGAGDYGAVYLAYLQETGVDVIGFLDDNIDLHGTSIQGIPVLGAVSLLESLKDTHNVTAVYCPIGSNRIRAKFLSYARELGYITPNFIHHTVNIAPSVEISNNGVYILQGSNIMPYAHVDDYVMISMGVNVAHHSRLSYATFISTGVNFGASVRSKDYAYVGIGAVVMTGVKELGMDCTIGAGAVVIKNVPDYAVIAGVPAKIIKYKNQTK